MKICLFTDVHWCTNSSIIRSRENNYSTRLDNLIKSMNWVNETALTYNCDNMICLGDMFDKSICNDEEITALREVKWNNLPTYFLCGNHESSVKDLRYSSLKILQDLSNNKIIINQPYVMKDNNVTLLFVPYLQDDVRKSIEEYKKEFNIITKDLIVLSHNDIAGLQYGKFTSTEGIKIEDIESNCRLFLNGHLHNGEKFCKNGYNLGNLTGQNFTEDAFKHNHSIFILDTDNFTLEEIVNPFAFNFYKIDIEKESDLDILDSIKNQSVLQLRCNENLISLLNEKVNQLSEKITEKRIIAKKEYQEVDSEEINTLNSSDYIKQFSDFILKALGSDEVVIDELQRIVR